MQLGGGIEFHDQQIAFIKGKAVFVQEIARPLWIIDHETENGAVGGVQNRHRQNMDIVGTEQLGEIMQATQAIGRNNRELLDRVGAPSTLSFDNHRL